MPEGSGTSVESKSNVAGILGGIAAVIAAVGGVLALVLPIVFPHNGSVAKPADAMTQSPPSTEKTTSPQPKTQPDDPPKGPVKIYIHGRSGPAQDPANSVKIAQAEIPQILPSADKPAASLPAASISQKVPPEAEKAPDSGPPPAPVKLVLNDVQQIHDGAPFHPTSWSFEVFINNAKVADIPIYHFHREEKVVPVSPAGAQWSDQPLTGKQPYSIRVLARRADGVTAEGQALLSLTPGIKTPVPVVLGSGTYGSFILHFSAALDHD